MYLVDGSRLTKAMNEDELENKMVKGKKAKKLVMKIKKKEMAKALPEQPIYLYNELL